MKLIKTVNTVPVTKQFDGVYSAKLDHKIESTTGSLTWTGPRIDPKDWWQVISFFQWCYDATKSECQARMFINPQSKKWIFWAFPQEARTGMTAREVETDAKKEQRSSLPDAGILVPFGTIHHHCSAGAFQSGTDENDEKNQEGLHITIGKMDEKRRDIHCRFYLPGGFCFEPDMSLLWDVGDQVRDLIPESLHDQIARWQMCDKKLVSFPEIWKKNLVEVKYATDNDTGRFRYDGGVGYSHMGATSSQWESDREEDAVKQIVEEVLDLGNSLEDLAEVLNIVDTNPIIEMIFQISGIHRVDAEAVIERLIKGWKKVEVHGAEYVEYLTRTAGPLEMDTKKGKKDKSSKKDNGKDSKKEESPYAEPLTKNYQGKDNFVGTHMIRGEPVYWEPRVGGWVCETGLMWDFGRKVWVGPEPKHRVTNERGEYWDSDLSAWVPV